MFPLTLLNIGSSGAPPEPGARAPERIPSMLSSESLIHWGKSRWNSLNSSNTDSDFPSSLNGAHSSLSRSSAFKAFPMRSVTCSTFSLKSLRFLSNLSSAPRSSMACLATSAWYRSRSALSTRLCATNASS